MVTLEMQPGRDGKPWRLCRACWADGALCHAADRDIAPCRNDAEQLQAPLEVCR